MWIVRASEFIQSSCTMCNTVAAELSLSSLSKHRPSILDHMFRLPSIDHYISKTTNLPINWHEINNKENKQINRCYDNSTLFLFYNNSSIYTQLQPDTSPLREKIKTRFYFCWSKDNINNCLWRKRWSCSTCNTKHLE